MKPKKDNGVVHGVDCKKLGSRYASALMHKASTRITDLHELKTHSVYGALKPEQQDAVRNNIRFITTDLLTMAGFAPETVARVLDGK